MSSAQLPAVLFVDDDESLLVTAAAIAEDDFQVTTARSGVEALACLSTREFDVLCTDLQMPGMDGLTLLQHVAQAHPLVSGVLITGHRDFLRKRMDYKLSYAVLLKPYQTTELIERLQRGAQMAKLKRTLELRKRADFVSRKR